MEEHPHTLPSGFSLIIDNLLNDADAKTKKFIINLNDTSASSSEDEINSGTAKEQPEPTVKQKSPDTEPNNSDEKAKHLEIYEKLKHQCLKQQQSNELRLQLACKELQYKQLQMKLTKKKTQMSDMNANLNQLQMELTRKQNKARRLYQNYTKATIDVNQLRQQINDSLKKVKMLEGEIDCEQKEMVGLDTECRLTRDVFRENNINVPLPSSSHETAMTVKNKTHDSTNECFPVFKKQLNFLNNLIDNKKKGCIGLEGDDVRLDACNDLRPSSACSLDKFIESPMGSNEEVVCRSPASITNSVDQPDTNRMITPESLVEFELNGNEDHVSPVPTATTTASKPVLNKAKKDNLLRKILIVETKNDLCEKVKNQKDQMLKKQMEDLRRDQEINYMKSSLQSKQLLNKLLISFKEVIQNDQIQCDTVDDQEFYMHCLNYLLGHLDYEQLDHLQLEPNSSESQTYDFKRKPKVYACDIDQDTTDQSVLEQIDAYRLSLAKEQSLPDDDPNALLHLIHPGKANCINLEVPFCIYDLHGTCNDEQCNLQHKTDYTLNDRQCLVDLLLYQPSITRFPNVEITRQNADELRNHLNKFVDNLLKKYSVCQAIRYVITLIRSSCDNSVLELQRCLPRNQAFLSNRIFGSQNTFVDFKLNIKVQDRQNVLTVGKVKSPDGLDFEPAEMFKNRYFEDEPVSLINKVEQLLQTDPSDVDGWIRLAYLHLNSSGNRKSDRKQTLQRAVHVLCTALDHVRDKSDLWCAYIFFLSNLICKHCKQTDQFDKTLHLVVRRILILCPNYEIWKLYLSACVNYLDKELLSSELLGEIRSRRLLYYDKHNSRDFRLISSCYLEIIFFKVSLHLELGQQERAEAFLGDLLCSNLDELFDNGDHGNASPVSIVNRLLADDIDRQSFDNFGETDVLVRQDKLFAWLCFVHLFCFGTLPKRNFIPFSQSFGPSRTFIISKQPFLIRFNDLKKVDQTRLCIIFEQALIDCFANAESNADEYVYSREELICLCLPLFQNLILLCEYNHNLDDALRIYDLLFQQGPNLVTLAVCRAMFEASHDLIKQSLMSLSRNERYKDHNICIMFPACLLHYRQKRFVTLNCELARIIRLFTQSLDDIPINMAFQKLLLDKSARHTAHPELFHTVNSRLWILCLICELVNGSEDQIDSMYQTLIALSVSSNEVDEYSLFLIHLLYLDSFVSKIKSEFDLQLFVERIQFACQQLTSGLMQYRLVKLFSDKLFTQAANRFHFVRQCFSLFPTNVYLLKELASLCSGHTGLRDRLHTLLKSVVTNANHKYKVPLFHWNLLLYFTLNAKQHFDAHQFFEQAVSSYPYNKHLWKHFIDYEHGLEHVQHLEVIRRTLKQLKLPQSF